MVRYCPNCEILKHVPRDNIDSFLNSNRSSIEDALLQEFKIKLTEGPIVDQMQDQNTNYILEQQQRAFEKRKIHWRQIRLNAPTTTERH